MCQPPTRLYDGTSGWTFHPSVLDSEGKPLRFLMHLPIRTAAAETQGLKENLRLREASAGRGNLGQIVCCVFVLRLWRVTPGSASRSSIS